mgnify:FL=1|tara:strand:- start:185 stop:454 length:270 start_codon:yes stop_codon:yes gene_type:complete
MSITTVEKKDIVKKFGLNDKDTGSSSVQIAILTNRIQYLTEHLKDHKKDFSSRRGLLKLVGRRRHLLDFLKKQDESKYKNILEKLKIRR